MKLNKKGQSLTIFIVLIPVLFLVVAFSYEFILIGTHNNEYDKASRSFIKEAKGDEERIKFLYELNKYDTERYNYYKDDGKIYIYNCYFYDSVFGTLLGIEQYRAEASYEVTVNGDKVKIKSVDTDDILKIED